MKELLQGTSEQSPFTIYQLEEGGEEGCYILAAGSIALVIDPGKCKRQILQDLKDKGLRLEAVLLTHPRTVEEGGIRYLKETTDCPVVGPHQPGDEKIDQDLIDEEQYCIGPFEIRVFSNVTGDRLSYHFPELGLLFSGSYPLDRDLLTRIQSAAPSQPLKIFAKTGELSPDSLY